MLSRNKILHRGFTVFTMQVVVIVAIGGMQLVRCSSGGSSFTGFSNPDTSIPVSMTYKKSISRSSSTNLALDGLSLVDTGTNIMIAVQGCHSGYSIAPSSPQSIASGVVNLYRGDVGCLVELIRFQLGSQVYKASNDVSNPAGAVSFTSYLAGGYATFAGASSSDLLYVFVNHQVTQSGVALGDSVAYTFTDLQGGATSNFSTADVSRAATIPVLGNASPNFAIASDYFLSLDSNGYATFDFDIACTGVWAYNTGGATATCDSNSLVDLVHYQLVPDNYSKGAITLAQATAAFNNPVAVSSGNVIDVGGNDGQSVNDGGPYTFTQGGFKTGHLLTSSQIDGPTPHLSWVLFAQLKDYNNNIVSYIYWYVEIPLLTQSVVGCGTTFDGGSGTVGDPFLVASRTTLTHIASCSSSSYYFKQTLDINLGGSSSPWTPIALSGNYDGNNHQITGLYINLSSNTQYAGLFSVCNTGSSVSNLRLPNVNITFTPSHNQPAAGALAGQVSGTGSVTNVTASGSVTLYNPVSSSNAWLGGLVGILQGTLRSSSSSVDVTLNPNTFTQNGGVGGLIGFAVSNANSVSISNSYATGNVVTSGGSYQGGASPYGSGGLIAYIYGGFGGHAVSITNSYSTGNQTLSITSSNTGNVITVGGLAGFGTLTSTTISGIFSSGTYSITGNNNTNIQIGGVLGSYNGNGTITNSYTMATISASGTHASNIGIAGGFIGKNAGTATISNTYAANPSITASGVAYNNGFIGYESSVPTVSTSYYYFNASTPSNFYTTGVTSYTTTTQMQTQSNFSGFDFSTPVWKMPSANPLSPSVLLSPVLNWQCGANGISCP